MKTIKERAETARLANHGYLPGTYKDGYIQGATEQKAIDIEKACEWFGNYLMDIGCPDDWMRDSKVQSSGEQRFRKAMEEEI